MPKERKRGTISGAFITPEITLGTRGKNSTNSRTRTRRMRRPVTISGRNSLTNPELIESLSALPFLFRAGGFRILDHLAWQADGLHFDPSFSILKCVLVTKSWFKYMGSCTMVVTINHESPLG